MDFRLVSATNRDLEALVAENTFRLDLYYRISPIVLVVPPLRERREDIGALVARFLRDVADRHGRPEPEVADSAIEVWMEQSWPGNARQLRHEVERAFVFAEDDRITADTLGSGGRFRPDAAAAPRPARTAGATIRDVTASAELALVRDAMRRLKGNKKRVAEELGISRSYLYKLLAGDAGAEPHAMFD